LCVFSDRRDEQIWDPRRAQAAKLRGENIDLFLSPARELNSQVLLLQALHQADYCVSKAELKFVDLYRANKEPSTEMSDREKAKADSMFETSRKDFAAIARVLNRSVAAVIAQYYYWKSLEKKGGTGGYARLKNQWKNEDDLCAICDDGGILIVCDHCHKSFHLECLEPPLKEAPETDWYCGQCLKSPAKLRRLPSLSLGTNVDDHEQPDDSKPRAMKALSFSTEGTSLGNQGHLPLLPSLEQLSRKSQAAKNVIDLTDDN
jgi:PHD-finger